MKSSAAYVTVVLTTGRCPSRELFGIIIRFFRIVWLLLPPASSEGVPDKSTVAVKLALRRKKPLLLSVSLSLTPYSWKEKLLKTPPGGDVPFWNVGSIVLIENAAPSRLSIDQGLVGTVPTRCSFSTALPSSRYSQGLRSNVRTEI